MIDSDGFRPNVGIVLCNLEGRVFWARRCGQNAWQFPQGGINEDESALQAMYRELGEETGLRPHHVQVLGCTHGWLRYRLPRWLQRRNHYPLCIGQKQRWFMLRMVADEAAVRLNCCEKPEFDNWCWVDYWRPLEEVVFFKRRVYARALHELAPLAFPQGVPKDVERHLPECLVGGAVTHQRPLHRP